MLGSPVTLHRSPALLLQGWMGTEAHSQNEKKRRGFKLGLLCYLGSLTSRSITSSAQKSEPKLLFPAKSQAHWLWCCAFPNMAVAVAWASVTRSGVNCLSPLPTSLLG